MTNADTAGRWRFEENTFAPAGHEGEHRGAMRGIPTEAAP